MSWTTFDSSGASLNRSFSDTPVGTITGYAGASAPTGWLLCNGATLSTTAYPELFAVIGYTYGGSGSSFILPNGDGDIIYAQSVSARIDSVTPPQYVTTLPSAPVNGQEIYYAADTASGVIWHFRYNGASSSSYKWEFLGGGALTASIDTNQTLSSGSGWQDLATAGPSIISPFAGDYIYLARCDAYYDIDQKQPAIGISINNANPAASDAFYLTVAAATSASNLMGSGKVNVSTATHTIKIKYSRDTTGTANFRWRYLQVTPVRVG